MASPSPSPVTRLRAKIETEVSSLATRSIMNVPTIVSPPMSSGSSAATASEEDQRQQEEQRECEELGRPKVPLDLIVDLLLGDCRSADRDAGLVVERAGDPLGGVLERVVVRGLQRDG